MHTQWKGAIFLTALDALYMTMVMDLENVRIQLPPYCIGPAQRGPMKPAPSVWPSVRLSVCPKSSHTSHH